MRWDAAARTDRGLRRARNEDAFALHADAGVYAVADGMGGHAAGDVASRIAVETLERAVAAAPGAVPERLADSVRDANRAIREHADANPETAEMGTTLTALALADAGFVIAHVGDSRCYRLREDALEQLTTDHTWVQAQVDAGILSPEQARHHPFGSVLLRSLGSADDVEVDTLSGPVRPGDLFLLCSDGLTGMVDDADLAAMLRQPIPLDALAEQLVEAANLRGGVDNITVVLARVVEEA